MSAQASIPITDQGAPTTCTTFRKASKLAACRRQRERETEARKQRWARISEVEKERLRSESDRLAEEVANLKRWEHKGIFVAVRREHVHQHRYTTAPELTALDASTRGTHLLNLLDLAHQKHMATEATAPAKHAIHKAKQVTLIHGTILSTVPVCTNPFPPVAGLCLGGANLPPRPGQCQPCHAPVSQPWIVQAPMREAIAKETAMAKQAALQRDLARMQATLTLTIPTH